MAVELYLIAGILITGAALAKLAEEYRFPYPIPLIIAGIILGQTFTGSFLPTEFGIDFIAQLALAAVLFYAGLTMNLKETKKAQTSIVLLATLGVLLTSVIAGVTIYFTLALPVLGLTLLIGAILSATDPAALFSVLESGGVRVKRKLFTLLEGEAVFNDATAVILVTTVYEPLIVPPLYQEWYIILLDFVLSMGLGVVIGYGVAWGIGRLVYKTVEDTNIAILTATTPILAYGIGEWVAQILLGVHPGALACVFAGIFLANANLIGLDVMPQKSMRGVTKNVSFVFEIAIFILLGFTLDIVALAADPTLVLTGIIVGLLVIFIARPASVFLVTLHDRTVDWKDRFLISWAGVKGVASAALAAIAVSVILEYGIEVENFLGISATRIGFIINSIVFIVIMMSLIIQGLTTPFIAKKLDLLEEQDRPQEITTERNAIRQALLHLVDQYTEGKVDSKIYSRLKMELEEQIFEIERELRKIVAERRARLRELEIREELLRKKLEYYDTEYEKGGISEVAYEECKSEIESELEELCSRKRMAGISRRASSEKQATHSS